MNVNTFMVSTILFIVFSIRAAWFLAVAFFQICYAVCIFFIAGAANIIKEIYKP